MGHPNKNSSDETTFVLNNLTQGDMLSLDCIEGRVTVIEGFVCHRPASRNPEHHIKLDADDEMYLLVYVEDTELLPRLYNSQAWTEMENENGITFTSIKGPGEKIEDIRIESEKIIWKGPNASEYMRGSDSDIDEDIVVVGSVQNNVVTNGCPYGDCGGDIVNDSGRVICQSCGNWCWREQWEVWKQRNNI